tara:strand:+ start:40 stop:1068 length:1029 start_codon:yes stop_codon:yes gene_type:complete
MKNKKDFRKRLTQEENEIITNHRALRVECETNGIPLSEVNHYWYKGKSFSLHVKNNGVSLDKVREDIIKAMDNHSPSYKKIKRTKSKDAHLLVIDPADIHIGKLSSSFETGEEYNSQIAVKRVKEGVQGILDKANGFNIDKILFVGGNDILHIDEPHRKTTAGTPQDTDGMWYDNFLTAKKLYIDILETLMSIADVHFVYNPSNHDYISGFMLSDSIQSWFRKSKNITFDCSIAHRKGFKYGKNLIGTTHGDGAKQADLPLIMANEFSQWWADTNHRYIYTHHIHHKTSKDYHGITIESLRSPSGTDSWHHRKGYGIGGVKAVEGFIHSKEHGQVARLTHIF